jgi:signal peptidase II
VDLIEGVVSFRLTFNSGGAFGILQGFPAFFLIATGVAGAVILLWVRHLDEPGWTVPLGLVLGGGVGNVIDRVVRDTPGVVDFVDLHVWPVFNVADMCIVMGVGIILFLGFRSDRAERRAEQRAEE